VLAVERRRDDVVEVRLLVGVRKVRRRRPARVRQLLYRLRTVGEALDPAVELVEQPARRVVARRVLDIEDASVDERVVRLQ